MKRVAIASLFVVALAARAERPPEGRKDADVVVTGTVEKVATKESDFGAGGVNTTYTATVKVTKVERGGVKPGDTVEVRWSNVTKRPSTVLPGAYGQDHRLKKKDEATFWLTGKKPPYAVIYSRDGVEKVKR